MVSAMERFSSLLQASAGWSEVAPSMAILRRRRRSCPNQLKYGTWGTYGFKVTELMLCEGWRRLAERGLFLSSVLQGQIQREERCAGLFPVLTPCNNVICSEDG